MSKIIISRKGFVDIHEYIYEGSEGDFINSSWFDISGQYDSIEDVISALNRSLGWDLVLNDIYYMDGNLYGTATLDEDGRFVTESDIRRDFKLFETGEIRWFTADLYLPLKVCDIHDMTEEDAESFGIPIY